MKTGYIILLFILLVIASGIAGYFIHKPKTITIISDPVVVTDPNIAKQNDSIIFVNGILQHKNDSLKRLLSKFGIKTKPYDSIVFLSLDCDTAHILQQLQGDIMIWQEISTNQDSIIIPLQRHEANLMIEVSKRDSVIYICQSKYTQETAILRRQKKNILITGGSVIATMILSILLLK